MGNQSIRSKDLSKLGYRSDVARGLAMNLAARHYKHSTKEEVLALLQEVLQELKSF
ncbi:hypothetical protein [Rufibacter ruber]|uniref:hypothetical protein n=1 Tax=Rufibacter ruber TaxID=1783499 RepID=UPI000ACB1C11|nr:hypothetical protein [Rufibacter ruber]